MVQFISMAALNIEPLHFVEIPKERPLYLEGRTTGPGNA